MAAPRVPRAVALSAAVYHWLLHAYPGEFRRAYGREMARVFRDACNASHARAGAGGVARFWCAIVGDLIGSATRERLAALRGVDGGRIMGEHRDVWPVWVGWIVGGAVAWGGGTLVATLLVGGLARSVGLHWMAGGGIGLIYVAVQGLLLVVAQAVVIRRYARHVHWWAGATAGGILLTLAAIAVGMHGDLGSQAVAYGVLLEGVVVGGAQWLALRRQVPRPGWWALATALGWPAAAIAGRLLTWPAFLLFHPALGTLWGITALIVLGATLGGALYGALLGRLLVALLRRMPRAADLPA